MSDLISRQALIKSINTQILGMSGFAVEIRQDLINIVASQPVAYDVDKVIDKLSNKMFSAELYGDEWDGQTVKNLLCMGDIYESIKFGGEV